MRLVTPVFDKIGDSMGYLTPLEAERNVPFPIRRVYYVYDTAPGVRRGFHAHRRTRQLAICVHGSCRFHMDDGREKLSVLLDANTSGLLIEPMIWHEMDEFSDACVLLVLASEYYDESDYIRSREAFEQMITNNGGGR